MDTRGHSLQSTAVTNDNCGANNSSNNSVGNGDDNYMNSTRHQFRRELEMYYCPM